MATKANKTVKGGRQQECNNAVDNFDAPVMDERIVKLNELKAVKMAAISSKKRPAAKEAKELATYILNNWDNQQALEQLLENAKDEAATELGKSVLDIAQNRRNQMNAIKIENGRKEAEERLKKTASKKETKKADKTERPKKKEAKTARKVGDVHLNHPTWIWTEYAEGKFDWRTNPADKKQGQRTDKATTSAKKSEPKKKAAKKETKPVKEEKKELTIEEFVALPKTTKSNKKPSEAQAKSLKLINKGYRITADKTFFEKDGNRESCNWDSVVALFRRYGIEYIPEGLVKSL